MIDNRKVKKRDGTIADFEEEKIINAVTAAFNSVGQVLPSKLARSLIKDISVNLPNPVDVEEIQNRVEKNLMDNKYFQAAKSFIIYREKHSVDRKNAERDIEFIKRFIESSNTADATIDDNANVTNKAIGTLNSEIHKTINQATNITIWTNKIHEMYPDIPKNQFIKDSESICYIHDLSSKILEPYTFSSKEVVEVLYNGNNLLLPLDLLYSIVNTKETVVDSTNNVTQKEPWHLYIKDRNNTYTKVTHLTKKKRHRDLVRVKTAFGEDIVVTDNHPLIIDSQNIDNTVEAINSLGQKQYKINTSISFKGKSILDLAEILPSWIEYGDNYIKVPHGNSMKRFISLNRDFGYIVGFFIGDGSYNNTNHYLDFSQKDKKVLEDINNKVFDLFGFSFNVRKDESSNEKYVYSLRNYYVFELFRNYFKIQDKAQNKTLPINILEFNEEFAKGILEGLIDSDGTIRPNDCIITIRLSSRAAILQCTALFRYFGYSVGNNMQSLPFSNNNSYKTSYTVWGIGATKRTDSVNLDKSFKFKYIIESKNSDRLKYHKDGECNIVNIDKIEDYDSFLCQNDFIYDVTTETHTFELNNLLVHNCMAITMYPLLKDGLRSLGEKSKAPKKLSSFCGEYINMLFNLAGEVKGAVATSEALMYFDYFCRKDYGEDYYLREKDVTTSAAIKEQRTIGYEIDQYFQQITHSINQSASNRGDQSPFTNFQLVDKYFFEGLFGDFYFPDGTQPIWESVDWLQKRYLHWLNEERLHTMLTFPVVAVACLTDRDGNFKDEDMYDFVCQEYAEGNSFFLYLSQSVDSLSSCCRLQNSLTDNTFSTTLGQLGVQTGSKQVITLNLNRIIQDFVRSKYGENVEAGTHFSESVYPEFNAYLDVILDRIYKYLTAYNELLYWAKDNHLYKSYDAGYINLDRQYLTIGINGLNQAAEFIGIKCSNNDAYRNFCRNIFGHIKEQNTEHRTKKTRFNTEQVPKSVGTLNLF